MAKDVTLTDKNNEAIYPRTFIKNVYDNDGTTSLDNILLNFVKDVDINDLDVRLTNAMNTEDLRLNNALNSLSMCVDANRYVHKSIGSITSANAQVYVAPYNGFATIRGSFAGTANYYVSDNGTNSFYQRASTTSSPFFALRKGASVYIESSGGTISWADLYFVGAKQI